MGFSTVKIREIVDESVLLSNKGVIILEKATGALVTEDKKLQDATIHKFQKY